MNELRDKFPHHSQTLTDLKFDALSKIERDEHVFWGALTFTWGAIWLKTKTSGPLPLFAKTGRLLKTPRVLRHYLYSALLLKAAI